MSKMRSLTCSKLAIGVMTLGAIGSCAPVPSQAAPSVVKIVKKGAAFQLMHNGKPYLIKGAGGDGDKTALKATGANSFRTWGAEGSEGKLAEAQKLGLTVTIGIWLGHKEHGFDYNNATQVRDQLNNAKAAIDRYKNHPALLMWGIGNEMEMGFPDDDPAVWKAVEEIAAYAKKVDPNHPTMTVVAEIGGNKVRNIHRYCPSIDVIGINSYGGATSIPQRYVQAGGTKPYALTEFGPPGTWEQGKNAWGVVPELSSTAKGAHYADAWNKAIANKPLALGGYAFTWGNKQEATATWYGMLLPDGSRLAAVDALSQIWTGRAPRNRVPVVRSLQVTQDKVPAAATIRATLVATDPEKDPLKVTWVLQADPGNDAIGGATQAVPPTYPDAIIKSSANSAEVKMPNFRGAYRLFATIHDGKGGAAIANVPLFVESLAVAPPSAARKVVLPLSLYSESGADVPYTPSGYMGNATAIKMTPDSTDNPHSGKTALKIEYSANDNWGGAVWQSPANDWGDAPGGYDLSGSDRVTFWARGAKGGEIVNFSLGLIARDKKYSDSGSGKLEKVVLTKAWKQYEIRLADQDLSRIKTGFAWVVAGSGAPTTFYLDDIRYEKGEKMKPVAKLVGSKAPLPFVLYDEAAARTAYIPAGYMGNTGAITMTENSTDNPHSGKTALKVEYKASDNWGGAVWQSPASDWGDAPGGHDLTGARKLSFWARGAKGGEEVTFLFGLIGKEKPYSDSATGKIEKVKLTTAWKQYSIDVAGFDLAHIKTGFAWTLGATGQPVTFYLDDIRYE